MLIEQFLQINQSLLRKLQAQSSDPLATSGVQAIIAAIQGGEQLHFADSTMSMLIDKLTHPEETLRELQAVAGALDVERIVQQAQESLHAFHGAWIEFPAPFDGARAIFSFVPSRHISTGSDELQIYLIDDQAQVVEVLAQARDDWHFHQIYHECASCRRERDGTLLLCERCGIMQDLWSRVFSLSAIIAGQYLAARRYEEREEVAMRRVPRSKSGKMRRVPIKHRYKVIDASEIIIHTLPEGRTAAMPEPRSSWLDETTTYDLIRTRPFQRVYRAERYIHARGQTTRFPEGIVRRQPRKAGRMSTTRVRASHYEERSEEHE